MKITVITVTYNSAATIVDTLRSVAAQAYPDIEHIVVDGGSTDATLPLVAEHRLPGTRVLSEPDRGIYDAMNKGLRLATGDYVGFLNSDDYYQAPDILAEVAAAAAKAEVPDAVYGDLVYVDPARAQPIVRYWRAGEFSLAKVRRGWMVPHPTLYVRRTTLQRVGPFDDALRIAGDYDFMLRLFHQPSVRLVHVPRIFVCMRVGGASGRSVKAVLRKSSEDLVALRRHGLGLLSLAGKNLQKVPMLFARPRG